MASMDMFDDVAWKRSRMEITCDILRAISRGSTRPTRIMQSANVTWGILLAYLDALVRNDMVVTRPKGRFLTYHLAQRGAATLKHYDELRGDLAALNLDSLKTKAVTAALKSDVAGRPAGPPKARLVEKLRKEGLEPLESSIVGRSGVKHEFDAVARSGSGLLHVYVIVQDEDKNHVLSMNAKQLDTDSLSHVMYLGSVTPEAVKLAMVYHIELIKW